MDVPAFVVGTPALVLLVGDAAEVKVSAGWADGGHREEVGGHGVPTEALWCRADSLWRNLEFRPKRALDSRRPSRQFLDSAHPVVFGQYSTQGEDWTSMWSLVF